jgi:iron complex outermembrane receptor protein
MRYFIALFLLFVGNQSFVYSQNKVSGKITNEKNEPLSGSHIHSGSNFTVSNPIGDFLMDLPTGRNRIIVSFVGYQTFDTLVNVTDDLMLHLTLKQDIAKLAEIVIRDNNVKINATSDRQVLKIAQLERYSSGSLGDALKEISGVSTLKTGNTIVKPVINGLHSSRVLIINNNVRMEDQQWGLEHAPNLDINSAGKVSVIKGASGLQYGGDAIGGVVIIEPLAIPVKDTLYGKTILNGASNGRGGSVSSSLFKGYQSGWNWNLQGTFKYLGDVEAPDYVLSNTGTREHNFSGGIGFKGENSGFTGFFSYYNATIGILTASHIGNISNLVAAIDSQTPDAINDFTYNINAPSQEVRHYLGKMDYYQHFSDVGKLTLQYAFQLNDRQEFDVRRGIAKNRPALDLLLSTHSMLADFETSKSEISKYKFGISGLYQNNFANTDTGIRPVIPNYNKYEAGIYSIATFALNEKLDLETGIRYDYSRINATKFYLKSRWAERNYDVDFSDIITGDFGTQWRTNPDFTYHNFSGSIGTKYQINTNLKWFANASLASRSPNPAELFSDGLHHATAQIELGDLRFKNEKAVKIATTLAYTSDKFALEINPYLNVINDFSLLEPTGLEQSNRGAFPVWEYRQVNAKLMGVDISADFDFAKNLNYRTSLAYVYGEDRDNREALIDMPPANWNNGIQYRKQEWNHLVLGLQSELVFTQNRFPDNDFVVNVPVDGEFVATNVAISQPPKGYHQLHFNSEMQFDAFEKSKITIGFNIQNVFNTNYRDYLNRTRFYVDEMGRNFTMQIKLNY